MITLPTNVPKYNKKLEQNFKAVEFLCCKLADGPFYLRDFCKKLRGSVVWDCFVCLFEVEQHPKVFTYKVSCICYCDSFF